MNLNDQFFQTLMPLVLLFGIFYFLLIRPQQQRVKRHQQMVDAVKKGDTVVTSGGIIGKVIHIRDNQLTIRSGESKVVVQRDRIAEVRTPAGDAPAS